MYMKESITSRCLFLMVWIWWMILKYLLQVHKLMYFN